MTARPPQPFQRVRLALGLLAALALAAAPAARAERDRLYSPADASSSGGIEGEIASPSSPILEILAVPPDEPRLVYRGTVTGSDRRSFRFDGLPMRKYDLVVIYDDRFFEGFDLNRGEDTLTTEDRAQINQTIQKAEPYFTVKTIHRLEGTTGRGNSARCVVTFLRDRSSTNGSDFRRAFKLVMLKQVGPGWQVVRTRDLYPTWTKPDKARPAHKYVPELSGIRVTDHINNIGKLNLTATH